MILDDIGVSRKDASESAFAESESEPIPEANFTPVSMVGRGRISAIMVRPKVVERS